MPNDWDYLPMRPYVPPPDRPPGSMFSLRMRPPGDTSERTLGVPPRLGFGATSLFGPLRLHLDPSLFAELPIAAAATATSAPASDDEPHVPPVTDPALGTPHTEEKTDEPNLWLASIYQGIGVFDHPGALELEANLAGLLTHGTGLPSSGWGGGLNEIALAIRQSAYGTPRNMSFDVGATGQFSYLSSAGFGPRRFPNALSLAGTLHYGWKADNDWGLGFYGQAGAAWGRETATPSWLGAVGGGSATLVVGHEPDEGFKYGFNATGSYTSLGQLSQGPTLADLYSLLGVLSVSHDLGPVTLSLEGYGGYSAGSGTSAAGGTGQSAYGWNAGGGIGLSIAGLGPLTPLDYGTPRGQTNALSFNLNYRHEFGNVNGPSTAATPAGPFGTDALMLTATFGFRRPPGADF